MNIASGSAGARRWNAGRIARGLMRAAMIAIAIWLAVVVAERFAPPPSTLMLGRWLIGEKVDRRWQPLDRISPHLSQAVIASEDQRFCDHWGVDWRALSDVLDEEGGPSRGASTITMQVVKNLYLWPGRSWLRKAMELPMALVVELLWSKERIMEVYLNIAEWGEGVFGAEAAARRHFGKGAADLSQSEAARLAAALPNPRISDPRHGNSSSRRIFRRMQGLGMLAACVE